MTNPSRSTAWLRCLAAAAALLVASCGGGGDAGLPAAPAVADVPAPRNLTAGYAAKSVLLQWEPVAGAVGYLVQEDPDGDGPLAAVNLGASATPAFAVTDLPLLERLNARYAVRACTERGCGASATVTPDITRAIGFVKASNPAASAYFGYGMALSADGRTLAVGAMGEGSGSAGIDGDQSDTASPSAGAVYVFTRDNSRWSQQAYVKASNARSGTGFGFSVALSADGNTLAVGANTEGSGATGIDGDQSDNSAFNAGAAYVFSRSGSTWRQQAYVKASNTRALANFGGSVALSADGNTLVVGSPGESGADIGINGNEADTSAPVAGAVYAFTRAGTTWSQQAYIKASNARFGAFFGFSVALSGNGDLLAVGAMSESGGAGGVDGNQFDTSRPGAGAAYTFTRTGGAWAPQSYLKAAIPHVGDAFGWSIALSADGSTLAAGSLSEDGGATGVDGNQADTSAPGAGSVHVFRQTGGTWSQEAYVKTTRVTVAAQFGASVALSADGGRLAVGAIYENSGARGIDGDQGDTSAMHAGAVYTYRRGTAGWAPERYLKAPNPQANGVLGYSVAWASDGTLAAGATGDASGAAGIGGDQADRSVLDAGAVYLY
jgi:hypothetical protein